MKLKDALGKPGEGVHFHVGGIAILDVLATIAVGCAASWWWGNHYHQGLSHTIAAGFWLTFILFVFGEALHLLIGVETTVAKWLKGES